VAIHRLRVYKRPPFAEPGGKANRGTEGDVKIRSAGSAGDVTVACPAEMVCPIAFGYSFKRYGPS
jgi:hypothetical protein